MKPTIEIEYCAGCRWLMRAAWTAQELLTTFDGKLAAVTMRPSEEPGTFIVRIDGVELWNRRAEGRFPEMKELKQIVRDHIAPEQNLGHSDTEERQQDV
ncbi:MAG: SelT/SelW/SelH family protein [Opitutales bacterium]|jgi:selenoprotein W-related protein|nr:SelT/SelW/SelH family protein [Opitutales bacterium]MDP4643385.1 SelT/SelW/SelH family protein [Opitutales bacterium]MDP4694358.1 SelT/SelW/SelH family protein [Opitutales bacterium]MDP4777824.1 SelT/SelW/SelH family protein [Opitutales bacterium]MDP4884356.1 SelT/SelW/SelH family protein [Opitutales bacterium]